MSENNVSHTNGFTTFSEPIMLNIGLATLPNTILPTSFLTNQKIILLHIMFKNSSETNVAKHVGVTIVSNIMLLTPLVSKCFKTALVTHFTVEVSKTCC